MQVTTMFRELVSTDDVQLIRTTHKLQKEKHAMRTNAFKFPKNRHFENLQQYVNCHTIQHTAPDFLAICFNGVNSL